MLSEIEINKLETLADDEVFQEAIKKFFFKELNIYSYDLTGLTNEKLGAIVRAKDEAVTLLENGFKALEQFKSREPKKPKINLSK